MDSYTLETYARVKQNQLLKEAEQDRLRKQVAPGRSLDLKLDVFGWDFTLTVQKHQPLPPHPALTAP